MPETLNVDEMVDILYDELYSVKDNFIPKQIKRYITYQSLFDKELKQAVEKQKKC